MIAKTGKKDVKKKVVDPVTPKDWYDIKAPSVFKIHDVGVGKRNKISPLDVANLNQSFCAILLNPCICGSIESYHDQIRM